MRTFNAYFLFPLPDLDPSKKICAEREFPLKRSQKMFCLQSIFASMNVSAQWINFLPYFPFPFKEYVRCHRKTLPKWWKGGRFTEVKRRKHKMDTHKEHTFVYFWLSTPGVTSYILPNFTSSPPPKKKRKKPSTTTIPWYPSGRSFQSFQRSKIWHKFSWGSNIRNSLLLLNHCSSSSLTGTTGNWKTNFPSEAENQRKCCGKDTIPNRDYKSNQTQSEENDEKYGSRGQTLKPTT